MNQNKKFTLITGASSGIGYELAGQYAQNGHHLILAARSTDKLNELKQELEARFNVVVIVITCDLSLAHSAATLVDEIRKQGLKVDGLVNNAGFGDHLEFEKSDLKKNLEMIQVNITTLTELTHLLVKDLIANSPSYVLNVASTAAFQPGPLMAVYYATKAYVLSFSEALHAELKDKNVFVTALCPGPTTSGFQGAANFSESNFISKMKFPTSLDVAQFGYRKTMAKQAVAIHGCMNWFMVFAIRFAPRIAVRNLVKFIQQRRN